MGLRGGLADEDDSIIRWGKLTLPASGFPLPAARFRLPASGFQLPAARFRLPASGFQLPASSFRLPALMSVHRDRKLTAES
jgi:hypothetical protein